MTVRVSPGRRQAASVADLGAQTITASILDSGAATQASTQTALNNIRTDLNDLKAKLRAAGLLAT